MKIKIYGSRGSMPIFSKESLSYGGNTSCVKIDIGGHIVIMDCGSGLLQFQKDLKKFERSTGFKFDILLSHLHYDHIIGLSTFQPIMDKNNDIRIFTNSRNDLPLINQIFGPFKPPYWPIALEDLVKSEIIEVNHFQSFKLSDTITVTPLPALHPDNTTSYHIKSEKTIVYMLDYELSENSSVFKQLVEFCKDVDVIIFDSHFLPNDYATRQGWGHSSCEHAVYLSQATQCKLLVLTHFCPEYSDKEIDSIRNYLNDRGVNYKLAFDGMELVL